MDEHYKLVEKRKTYKSLDDMAKEEGVVAVLEFLAHTFLGPWP